MTRVLKPLISDCFANEGFEFSGVFDFSFLYSNEQTPLQRDLESYKLWLREHWHAQMNFMEKNLEARTDARHILENVRSAIVFLIPYAVGERVRPSKLSVDERPQPQIAETEFVQSIARYARGRDYHKVLKAHGEQAIARLKEKMSVPFEARTIVDSAPFFERAHAKQAGLGFVGKNTMLIRPGVGSFFFIATVLTTLSIDELSDGRASSSTHHALEQLDCGSCRKCLEACPTGALTEYALDANKCLSYLSIEHRGVVAAQYIPHFKEIFFGCDVCQTACPYNHSTTNALRINELAKTHKPLLALSAERVAMMNFSEYEHWFGGTAITRAKYAGLVRNALYVLWAQKHPAFSKALEMRKSDPEPMLRDVVLQLSSL